MMPPQAVPAPVARTKPYQRAHRGPARRGFSLLEFEVALIVLGIAFSGMFPLAVMYSRGLEALERRTCVGGTWYIVPSSLEWARKLGASASITSVDPGPKPAPPILVIDDGETGYTDTGAWQVETNSAAFQGHRRRHAAAPGGSSDTATWTFTSIPVGWYRIEATWSVAAVPADQTNSASYSMHDGDYSLGTFSANQQNAPTGDLDVDNWPWQILTAQFIRNGTVTVTLSVPTTGQVVVDGMRLVPAGKDVQVLSLDKTLTSEEVTAHVSVN
jgi:type II secretory pathway pseudopilin PulG